MAGRISGEADVPETLVGRTMQGRGGAEREGGDGNPSGLAAFAAQPPGPEHSRLFPSNPSNRLFPPVARGIQRSATTSFLPPAPTATFAPAAPASSFLSIPGASTPALSLGAALQQKQHIGGPVPLSSSPGAALLGAVSRPKSQPALSTFAMHVNAQKRALPPSGLAVVAGGHGPPEAKRMRLTVEEEEEAGCARKVSLLACAPLPLPAEPTAEEVEKNGEESEGHAAVRNVTALQELCLRQVTEKAATFSKKLEKSPDKIRNLVIQRIIADGGAASTVCHLLPSLREMKHLDLTGAFAWSALDLSGVMSVLESSEIRLTGLSLARCDGVTDSLLLEVARACPQISRLDISRCYQVTNAGLSAFFNAVSCSSFRHLSLSGCYSLTDGAFTAFCGTPSAAGELRSSREPFALEYLDISACQYVSEKALFLLATRCTRLKHLLMKDCTSMAAGFAMLIARFRLLETLVLSGCPAVTADNIRLLADSCSNLRRLDLASCEVGSNTVLELGACKNLQHLDLSECENVTDAALQQLSVLCPHLEVLLLSNIRTSVDPLLSLASRCTKLRHFDVRGSLASDDVLRYLSVFATNLEKLNVSFCQHVTPGGMVKYVPRMPHLSHLCVWGSLLSPAQTSLLHNRPHAFVLEHISQMRTLYR